MSDPICAVCGVSPLAADAHVEFEGKAICAKCKPSYFQRLREGVLPELLIERAFNPFQQFWIRTGKMALYWLAIAIIPTPVFWATINDSKHEVVYGLIISSTPILGMEFIRWRMKLKWRDATFTLLLSNTFIFIASCIPFLFLKKLNPILYIQNQDRSALFLIYFFLLPAIIFAGMFWSIIIRSIIVPWDGLKWILTKLFNKNK